MGAVKHRPWDDAIQFDDWKKEDASFEEEKTKELVENSAPAEIQGLGIQHTDDNEEDLFAMIQELNAGNSEYAASVAKEEKLAEEKARALEEQKEREQQAEVAKRVYEAEQAEKDRIAFEEAQELAQKVAEEQARKENSITKKISSLIGTPGKKKKSSKENMASEENQSLSEEKENFSITGDSAVDKQDGVSELDESVLEDIEIQEGNHSEENEIPTPNNVAEEFYQGKVEKVGKRKPFSKDKRKKDKIEKSNTNADSVAESSDIEENSLVIEDNSLADSVSNAEYYVEPDSVMEDDYNKEIQDNANAITEKSLTDKDDISEQMDPVTEPIRDEEAPSKSIKTEESEEKEESFETVEQEAGNRDSVVESKEAESKVQKKEKKSLFRGLFKSKQKKTSDNVVEEPAISNVQEKGNEEPDWEFIATHDSMTGLLNQNAYSKAKDEKRSTPYAVVFLDVNNLKYANDTFGHEAGNKLIVAVAEQVKTLFPDCGYRIGGDEFVAIVPYKKTSKIDSDIAEKKKMFLDALQEKTREEKDSGLIYSASFGYAYSDGKKPFEEVAAEADKAMYANKIAYKKANPQYDMRKAPEKKTLSTNMASESTPTPSENYDEFLTEEQRNLKKLIQDKHVQVSNKSTMDIVREVQQRSTEVVAILIASPTFDQLFIILSADEFCGMVSEFNSVIDFSYLYIIYRDCTQYKGSDEYFAEVTDIFEALGKGLTSGRIKSPQDIKKIKGINIFKDIMLCG